jgi:hypothetical protein
MIPQDLEFTRPSTATRINEEGMIETVPAHQPRIDYDPNTGACRGLLIEPERTNLITTTSGARGNVIGGPDPEHNTIKAPDGTMTADKMVCGQTGRVELQVISSNTGTGNVALDPGVTYSFSAYIKPLNVTLPKSIRLDTYRHGFISSSSGQVDLTGGWQRFEVHGATTNPNATSSQRASLKFIINSDFNGETYAVWAPQIEVGPYATSLIPTNGSPETRAVDLVHVPDVFDGGHIPDGCVIVSDLDRHSHRMTQNVHTWTLIDGEIATHQRHWASGPIGVDTRWASWNGAPQWPCTEGHAEGRQVLATQIARDGLRQFKDGDQVADIQLGGSGNCREYQWRPENLPTGPVDLEFGEWTNKREVAARYHRLQFYDRPLNNNTLRKLTMNR